MTWCLAAAAGAQLNVWAAASGDWPQWRGPVQTGVAPGGNPPSEWSETKNVKWKVKVPGEGHATPIIWGDKVFVLSAVPTGKRAALPEGGETRTVAAGAGAEPGRPPGGPGGQGGPGGRGGRGGFGRGEPPTEIHQFSVFCLDRKTGKILWQQIAREELPHEGHHATGSYAPSSPVTDGKHVIAYFGSRGLYCYDLEGKLQWSQDLGDQRMANNFGEGSSPALHGNVVVVKWDHEGESFIVALDKNTGKTLWKQPRPERTSWSTPLIVEHGGKTQVITAATGKIRSYDLANGDLIWECGGLFSNVIPTPVAADGIVYCMSGFRGNALLAIRLGKTGDLTDSDAIVWRHGKSTPYVPSPLLYGGRLYCLASNSARISCFDAKTGQIFYEAETVPGAQGMYASPVGAGDRIYLAGQNGVTAVLKNSDKLEVLATNTLEDRFDASPAISGGELFLRGRNYLYCIAQ